MLIYAFSIYNFFVTFYFLILSYIQQYLLLSRPTAPTVSVYVWSKHKGMQLVHNVLEAHGENCVYYVQYTETILVFRDKRVLLQKLPDIVDYIGCHRGRFRHFMEAFVKDTTNNNDKNILPLIHQYDNGYGSFYQGITEYALTAADLYAFDTGTFVAPEGAMVTLTSLATMEPVTLQRSETLILWK